MSDPHARIAELEAELAAVRREMQDFAYAVSHDLRAPLRHIVSYAHLVQEDAGPQLDAEVQGFLATITDSAKHLGAMLDALLELSRVGTLPPAPGPVDLKAVLDDVVAALVHRGAPRQLALEIDLPEAMVVVDATLLRVVLGAVLDNAWKFTALLPEADARVWVRVQREASGPWALEVRDNGAGFAAPDADLALRMFGRLHGNKLFPGLGVGLALAAKAAQRMGAVLRIQAAVPAGCVVTLSFPSTQKSPDMPGLVA
ncbi:HAMP domain-containing sensor histidine kinase [Rhodoferax saidenbachensis]|uniref:histidine kinase n=1 Tax=Rhodoferax saidenbachensis TaxID=1484693 RepID=A0ABU1ZRR3_9BURK|nr:HAMP domain-containing sensor histidine kinase [Rhodoferax saidenbachensis]MDR7308168.1 signal transduction histidine kinase [Rhodoferax saidenbachensis]